MLAGQRQLVWLPAAELLAMQANTHLERFRRKSAFTPRHFLPPDVRRDTPVGRPGGGSLTLGDMEEFLEPE